MTLAEYGELGGVIIEVDRCRACQGTGRVLVRPDHTEAACDATRCPCLDGDSFDAVPSHTECPECGGHSIIITTRPKP